VLSPKRKQVSSAPVRIEVPHYDVVALVLQGGGALGAHQAGAFHKDWGKGPVVTFSHGWPLNADAWDG